MSYQPIENYGIIGDLHTVALVGMDGAIDFMCFPQFDSPTVFAALLDHEKGGSFRIQPLFDVTRQKQLYLTDTNILLTRFHSPDGVAEISDFMPVEAQGQAHNLVRRVKMVQGRTRFRVRCAPRFDYARATHCVKRCGDHEVLFVSDGVRALTLRLRSTASLRVLDGDVVAEFALKAGESQSFVLEDADLCHETGSVQPRDVSRAFKETANLWRAWIRRSSYEGHWRESVNRSALTLKLLTSVTSGSIVAAPTFGLPEELGGSRNWDYRYTWIRDAAFTVYAFLRLGYTEEAGAFMRWIEARCSDLQPDGALQVIYATDGRKEIKEEVLSHLGGYRGSAPVRIGNNAYQQLQLDMYGALMDAVYLYNKYGEPISHDLWENLTRLLDWVCVNWNRPDHGIWEIRGRKRDFLSSRVMCWVALDRGVRLASKRSFPGPTDRWVKTRNEIYRDLMRSFWSVEKGTFVRHTGGAGLDASSLLMPLVKFISPTDPRWLSTLHAIERELVQDSLVYRYGKQGLAEDGVPGHEGSFSLCSFWYVECLSRAGDFQKARFYFEKMMGHANHLGLYSEELGLDSAHLGNYPQALTHLALISAAYDLNRRLG